MCRETRISRTRATCLHRYSAQVHVRDFSGAVEDGGRTAAGVRTPSGTGGTSEDPNLLRFSASGSLQERIMLTISKQLDFYKGWGGRKRLLISRLQVGQCFSNRGSPPTHGL